MAPDSPSAGRRGYAVLAFTACSVLLFCALLLRDYDHPLARIRRTAEEGSWKQLFSSPRTTCGISPSLLNEFGLHNFRLSQVHVGSGYRTQRFLDKAQHGEKLRVGLIGGSGALTFPLFLASLAQPPSLTVSLGHGTDTVTGQRNKYGAVPVQEQWHQLVMRYLEEAFPTAELHFRNGAKPATDSSFFEWCWTSLIGTDVDLVFIELAVNDDPNTSFTSSENLLRSLLQLDSQPAVVYVDTFSLHNTFAGKQQTLLSAQDIQSTLSPFYDVPQVSARPALLPAMIRDHSLKKPWFRGDERHGSTRLHRFLGSMVVGYLMEERCRIDELTLDAEGGGDWPNRAALVTVPQVTMRERWNSTEVHATKPPACATAGAGLVPANEPQDWKLVDWKYSKYYYEALVPNSDEIIFNVDVREGAQGFVAISYLRSRQYDLGRARCMVGERGADIDGHWENSASLAQTAIIADKVPPGRHRVRCRTLAADGSSRRSAFRVMGVMSV
ncbi:capsular related protein, Esterase, SGNH hydrolase-type domain containing [Rhodotorula toruloides]|uniref:Capsular related protein, Esterase, SGNH hydrolase-type domain containing n=1 Tax=Rhodotorula toruloides TaxID=5286 RepID=A0A511K7A3_RHOTO|nr:capsular related protein, Esterase, SGNH hydrolase-type domain containing [Rhodotorula toruloides]